MDEVLTIENTIYEIRGFKVMLDSDLAKLYEVTTFHLNQAVNRNIERFPDDFMFQLTGAEWQNLRSQNVIFTADIRKYKPYAFTEHGILMLSSVLRSVVATEVNIKIMRVFVAMRQYALDHIGTNDRIADLHKLVMLYIEKNDHHSTQTDERLDAVITVLNGLIERPPVAKQIGFVLQA
jgi:hypothetical protein